MSTFTSFAGQLQADFVGAMSPTISQVPLTAAATEYSFDLPVNCRQFMIKLQGRGRLQVSYVAGQSGTVFMTVPRDCFYAESDIKLASTTTLYFQSNLASQVAEIVTWT